MAASGIPWRGDSSARARRPHLGSRKTVNHVADYDRVDPSFVDDLKRSDAAVRRVADYIRRQGWEVRVPALRVRPTATEMAAFADDGDLFARKAGGAWRRIEITVRRFAFDGPAGWPYPTVIFSTVHAWRAADPKPFLMVRLSQDLACAAIVGDWTREHWREVKKFDRGRTRSFLECPKARVLFRATPGL